MLKTMSATFGSTELLQKIIDKHPERSFKLLQSSHSDEQLQLLDLSDEPSVFMSPINYAILASSSENPNNGVFHFEHFSLGEDDRKVLISTLKHYFSRDQLPSGLLSHCILQNEKDQSEIILLTNWQNQASLKNWKLSASYQTLTKHKKSTDSFFEQTYLPVQQ